MVAPWLRGAAAWASVLLALAVGRPAAASANKGGEYIIASFPHTNWIMYSKVPSTSWQLLVDKGLTGPKGLAVDATNMKLYIIDSATLRILWYQLLVLPSGKLITDGRQHIAVEQMRATALAVDGTGNLYFAGKFTPAIPQPVPFYDSIYKHSPVAMATGDYLNYQAQWSRDNSGTDKRSWLPSTLAIDSFSIYWGNEEAGSTHGSLLKAPPSAPTWEPEKAIKMLADNENRVTGVGLSATGVYYGTSKGIYGVSKTKASTTCGSDECKLISATAKDVTSIWWNGDGSMFAVDKVKEAIYEWPSGSLGHHTLKEVNKAPGIYAADVLIVDSSSDARNHALGRLASALAALAALLTLPRC